MSISYTTQLGKSSITEAARVFDGIEEKGGLAIRPPSLPSNTQKINDNQTPVFNLKGYYSDLENRLDDLRSNIEKIYEKSQKVLNSESDTNI